MLRGLYTRDEWQWGYIIHGFLQSCLQSKLGVIKWNSLQISIFYMTWSSYFPLRQLVWGLSLPNPSDQQTISIFRHVGFHVIFSSISWHPLSSSLSYLITLCKTKWGRHSFLNQWYIRKWWSRSLITFVNPIWVLFPQKSGDHQTLSIFGYVGFSCHSSSIFWHPPPWSLPCLTTQCKRKWNCHPFLNQW